MKNVFVLFQKEPLLSIKSAESQLTNNELNILAQTKPTPDVAIIEFVTPFELNQNIVPACLPTKPVSSGTVCYASGWGITSPPGNGDYLIKSDILRAASLTVITDEKCQADMLNTVVDNFVPDFELCAGDSESSTCIGDSGGPLICEGMNCSLVEEAENSLEALTYIHKVSLLV